MEAVLDDMKKRFVPNEVATAAGRQGVGQLGFDYGYHQAIAEIGVRIYLAFRAEGKAAE
jgi:hypothetical protein